MRKNTEIARQQGYGLRLFLPMATYIVAATLDLVQRDTKLKSLKRCDFILPYFRPEIISGLMGMPINIEGMEQLISKDNAINYLKAFPERVKKSRLPIIEAEKMPKIVTGRDPFLASRYKRMSIATQAGEAYEGIKFRFEDILEAAQSSQIAIQVMSFEASGSWRVVEETNDIQARAKIYREEGLAKVVPGMLGRIRHDLTIDPSYPLKYGAWKLIEDRIPPTEILRRRILAEYYGFYINRLSRDFYSLGGWTITFIEFLTNLLENSNKDYDKAKSAGIRDGLVDHNKPGCGFEIPTGKNHTLRDVLHWALTDAPIMAADRALKIHLGNRRLNPYIQIEDQYLEIWRTNFSEEDAVTISYLIQLLSNNCDPFWLTSGNYLPVSGLDIKDSLKRVLGNETNNEQKYEKVVEVYSFGDFKGPEIEDKPKENKPRILSSINLSEVSITSEGFAIGGTVPKEVIIFSEEETIPKKPDNITEAALAALDQLQVEEDRELERQIEESMRNDYSKIFRSFADYIEIEEFFQTAPQIGKGQRLTEATSILERWFLRWFDINGSQNRPGREEILLEAASILERYQVQFLFVNGKFQLKEENK